MTPELLKVADRRGLTAFGAVSVALGLALLGGAVDAVTGEGLRTLFAVCFVLGCVGATLLVHRESLFATVVMPPLVYLFVAVVAGGIEASGAAGPWLTREFLELATSLIVGAKVLLVATGLSVLVAFIRWQGARAGRGAARAAGRTTGPRPRPRPR